MGCRCDSCPISKRNLSMLWDNVIPTYSRNSTHLVTLIIHINLHNSISFSISFGCYKLSFGEQDYSTRLRHVARVLKGRK